MTASSSPRLARLLLGVLAVGAGLVGCAHGKQPDRTIAVVIDEIGDASQARISALTHRYVPSGNFTVGQSTGTTMDTSGSPPTSTSETTLSWRVAAEDAAALAKRLRAESHVVSVSLAP
jgi:hypothetical protein